MYKDAKPAPNAGVPYLPTGDSGDKGSVPGTNHSHF